jgi:hypothetical protein
MNAQQLPTRSVIKVLLGMIIILVAVGTTHAASPGARIVRATGTVEVLNAPSAQWVTASSQTVLPLGSAVRTGSKSTVVLELDGATVTLYETSLIRIPSQVTPASTATNPLRHPWLDSGRGLFDVTPRKDRLPFSVQTPTVVAGVKGTVFEVSSTGTEEAVYVWDGLVEVTSRLDSTDLQLVGAGQFTAFDDLRLTPVLPIPGDRVQPDEVDLDRHKMEASMNEQNEQAAPTERAMEDFPVGGKLDTTTVSLTTKAWRDADRAAVKNALDGALDFQSVVSLGTVRTPSTTVTTMTDATTRTVSETATTVVDPVTATMSSTIDATTAAVSSATDMVNTSVVSVTDTLTSTVSSTVETTTATVSSVVAPLTTLGF